MIIFDNAKIQNICELYLIKRNVMKFYHIYFTKPNPPRPTLLAPRGL